MTPQGQVQRQVKEEDGTGRTPYGYMTVTAACRSGNEVPKFVPEMV